MKSDSNLVSMMNLVLGALQEQLREPMPLPPELVSDFADRMRKLSDDELVFFLVGNAINHCNKIEEILGAARGLGEDRNCRN